jgi:hypothetical protein
MLNGLIRVDLSRLERNRDPVEMLRVARRSLPVYRAEVLVLGRVPLASGGCMDHDTACVESDRGAVGSATTIATDNRNQSRQCSASSPATSACSGFRSDARYARSTLKGDDHDPAMAKGISTVAGSAGGGLGLRRRQR